MTGEFKKLLQARQSGSTGLSSDVTIDDTVAEAIYKELLRRARTLIRAERSPEALSAADLVSEVWLRLAAQRDVEWRDRVHFFSLAAHMMRRVLVDHARARKRLKRSADGPAAGLTDAVNVGVNRPVSVLLLDDALEALARLDARQSQVVILRFFGGLSAEETATELGMSKATVDRDWTTARMWLIRELNKTPEAIRQKKVWIDESVGDALSR